ncbi:MAG: glycosyltransferase, partial [Maribacter sp.]
SGVNLSRYPFRVYPAFQKEVKFVIVARLIKEKGIKLFMDAALALKQNFPLASFHIIGAPDNTPSAIALEELQELHDKGVVVYHGSKSNVPDFLKEMHVFVLPTYYREGVPRSLLEALSIGMPIITTNTPGCKETVFKEENGMLIPPKNLESLIEACSYFLNNPGEIVRMGEQSRKLAEKKFDVHIINKNLINYIDAVLR